MNPVRPTGGVQDVLALRQEILARNTALREVHAATDDSQGAGETKVPGAGFADTLSTALRQVNAVQQRSSDLQVGYERGEVTDIAQVMLARQEAGVAFEATLQVRNKLLSAYQDIMRMGG
ncbi:flagellar hook-basal body complex protein FliE [Erythrobacter litoralis]|jgi:flagellar hook-basal body complex protein FliE|uniref:Flagellar hook-basal body complex protein FliE n=1 Tax=Erythrobacter litoralis TaxID=39960 RepID=A0A074MCI4_9SPHN|nr:flagellar hook-basal body complex protein FliE [Erythrobacter litoralis]AOL22274.1 flagellar hook-basal body complex protein FliE [Erythrobacter litoralis]KEO89563.1 flagellar hook-basal body protein FliE [Erythrobacter litoralis]MEE4337403.1 flagellar hook-basal body complex protein FliE [Erythrobacter sp.]